MLSAPNQSLRTSSVKNSCLGMEVRILKMDVLARGSTACDSLFFCRTGSTGGTLRNSPLSPRDPARSLYILQRKPFA